MKRAFLLSAAIAAVLPVFMRAQVPGRNINMVSGVELPNGDPYLQRQNEPSIAVSTRNPLHLLAGSNDYRTVDLPGLPDSIEVGDAWMGLYKSTDGGATWQSGLLPGYPQEHPSASPLKGYAAAADPVVRAGTNGLFYYSGIVFDRGTGAKSAMFVARFIDNNTNVTNPIAYIDTKLIATNPGTAFIDKPWIVVDIPRAGAQTCTITTTEPGTGREVTQSFPGGAVYAAYSVITGIEPDVRSQIYLSRSTDCGKTWSAPQQISSSLDPINQGVALAIDPRNGAVYLAWRRFSADGTDDSIMVTRSTDQGRKWDPPGRARRFPRGKKVGLQQEHHGKKFNKPFALADLTSLDQPTREDRFRSNAYPTMTVDDTGRVYVAWAERGFSPVNPDPDIGDARILIATSTTGAVWTEPHAVDNGMTAGHQLMPSLTFAGGKLMMAYYDLREDVSQVFGEWIDETSAVLGPNRKRHTVDIRAAEATPGAVPVWRASIRVSEYLLGKRHGDGPAQPIQQLQYNPPNLKLFALGTVPFIGDYIDLTPSPAFVPDGSGGWMFNTAAASSPLYHVVWTDNRDVIPPVDGDWTKYSPPGSVAGQQSTYDPTQTLIGCQTFPPPNETISRAGMRNQNVYTARITGGLIAGAPDNSKALSPDLQRTFVVYAQNTTNLIRTFRLTIDNQPTGGRASFSQLPLPPYTGTSPAPLVQVDATVPPRSTIARTIFATSTNPAAQINVSVKEVAGAGGTVVVGGLDSRVILNPDISNPDISNPDISNPDISNPDISNPDISNPDISNPDISNPDISNPDISNPDISNVQVANPDISNPDISNPDISNPDISNPDISNPDISNPDISNQSLTDTTWTITNSGNTPTAYNVALLLNGTEPSREDIVVQLILHKRYLTPAVIGCDLVFHTTNILLSNIVHPDFKTLAEIQNPDISNPDISNATLWLAPQESAQITVRRLDVDIHDDVTFEPAQDIIPVVLSQPLNVVEGVLDTDRPLAVPALLLPMFMVQPANGTAGAPLATAVRVFDAIGASVPGATVTLNWITDGGRSGPASQTHIAVTNADGVAVFNNVSIPEAGMFRLRATASLAGYQSGEVSSDPFAIFEMCAAAGSATVFTPFITGLGGVPEPIMTRSAGDGNGDGHTDVYVLSANGTFTRHSGDGLGRFSGSSSVGPVGEESAIAFVTAHFNAHPVLDAAIITRGNQLIVLPSNATAFGFGTRLAIALTARPTSIASADLDGDGHADIAITEAATEGRVRVLWGDGTGTFSLALSTEIANALDVDVTAVHAADLDTDGDTDLIVGSTNDGGHVTVVRNLGTRNFAAEAPLTVGGAVTALAGGHLNGDAWPDVVIADADSNAVHVLHGSASGALMAPVSYPVTAPVSVALGDFDNDDDLDIATVTTTNNTLSLMFNDGNGIFGTPRAFTTGTGPVDVTALDFNADGLTDVITTNRFDGRGTLSRLINSCGVPTADLRVTMTAAPDPATPGANVTFTTAVTNAGPFAATAVRVTQSTSGGTWVSATPSVGTCTGLAPTTCDLGTLQPGESQTVVVIVRASTESALPSTATARSDTLDLNPVNNSVLARTTIVGVPRTFVVTNTNDSGPGSLRQALLDANANAPANDFITFNIPGVGPHTITPASALPTITDAVVIDGRSEPDFDATPVIEISGAAAGASVSGLRAQAAADIRALVINRFSGSGIFLGGAGGSRVSGSYIGTDVTGVTDQLGGVEFGNAGGGIDVFSPNNVIGGTTPGERNVISGNAFNGVLISTGVANDNIVIGNYIGVDVNGTRAVGNNANGVFIAGGSRNRIGGDAPGQANVISGNFTGVSIHFASAVNNRVEGNLIGMSANCCGIDANPIPNTTGVWIAFNASNNSVGISLSTATGAGNVIAGNQGRGVLVSDGASGNTISGNAIGSDRAGDLTFANGSHGIEINASNTTVGGPGTFFANIVKYNLGTGVRVAGGTGNAIRNNGISNNQDLGIDLGPLGVTPNDPGDADAGANDLQNAPELTLAREAGTSTRITGVVNSTPSTAFGIEFYASVLCDGSGFGEGATPIGTATVTSDAAGVAGFDVTVPISVLPGSVITAVATNAAGSSSEFSACITVTAAGAGLVVTNTNDSGAGSLRQAITDANLTPGTDRITFNIPGPGPHVIAVSSALPTITDSVELDGGSQPGYANEPVIELTTSTAAIGLRLNTSNSLIRALTVTGFTASGIHIEGGGNNSVRASHIGFRRDATGAIAAVPNGRGIVVANSVGNTIGGRLAGAGNVISGNANAGVDVALGATGTVVEGNLIGTDRGGTIAVPNSVGVVISNVGGVQVGGTEPGARNVISGNAAADVQFSGGGGFSGNQVLGNYIGVNAAGTAAIGSNNFGVMLAGGGGHTIGGSSPEARNVISGHRFGVFITNSDGAGNTVVGNYIGLNAAGDGAIPNSDAGVRVMSTDNVIRGNVISGNRFGIDLLQNTTTVSNTTIQGNFIGTNPAGTAAIPNTLSGILISSASTTLIGGTEPDQGNLISGNAGNGVNIQGAATGTRVQGNRIGTNAGGTAAVPNGSAGVAIAAANSIIGGASAAARNVISGNLHGVTVTGATSTGNVIAGNYIGTDVNGTAAVPNTGLQSGVFIFDAPNNTIGGSAAGEGNVISGNAAHAITIVGTNATGNLIQGNLIGTNATGTAALPNNGIGIDVVSASNNVVGGAGAARNVISGNILGMQIRTGATGNRVQNNYFGLDATGTAAVGNGNAISISDAANGNTIGGATGGLGNVISGNRNGGILIESGVADTAIEGNLIGTDASGSVALGNGIQGIVISGSRNRVGGPTAAHRNVISGQGGNGVETRALTSDNIVQGNYIGVNATATAALPNRLGGIVLQGSNHTVADNVISGNLQSGLVLFQGATGITIKGNFIGTDGTGTAPLANGHNGVYIDSPNNIVGGTTAAERNLISGNTFSGIHLDPNGGGTLIKGNYIGVNAGGAAALANGIEGVLINSNDNVVGGLEVGAGNVISGNANNGVSLSDFAAIARGNRIEGNRIGTDPGGTIAIPNRAGVLVFGADNTIGGPSAAARNIISGNRDDGVSITGQNALGNLVQGNYIGVDVNGTADLGNGQHGVLIFDGDNNVVGGADPSMRNVISGNLYGVSVHFGDNNAVIGNFIGVDASGITARGNDTHAVNVTTNATNTRITNNTLSGNLGNGVILSGGSTGTRLEGNFIGTTGDPSESAPNGSNGVTVVDSTSNTIAGNAIGSNGGLGIDLGGDGVTLNDAGDADAGANGLQNYPVLTSATGGPEAVVNGTLNSTPNTPFIIALYASAACDPSGFGEGARFLDTTTVTTDAAGNASFSHTVTVRLNAGERVTATATSPAGNTSEFSACITAGGGAPNIP